MSYSAWSLVYGEQPSVAKWNILGSNDAHFYDFLGANLEWQSYTPTWTNFTVGNGTNTASYTRVGKLVIMRQKLVRGSTTTFSGLVPTFTLPINCDTTLGVGSRPLGNLMLEDLSAGSFLGYYKLASASTVEPVCLTANTTYATVSRISSTAPFTWTTGDYLAGTLMYLGV